MAVKTPVLGYPSKTAAVIALRKEGLSTSAIARKLFIAPSSVSALEASHARSMHQRSDRPEKDHGRAVLLTPDVYRLLGPHAARRDMSVSHLARLIIETAVDEKMIDAILDDEVAA